ncbi:MAG TPA: hypothetical protein EYP36_04740, partial [Calditrichaeota bacterium]|nr:hypothetical protein [Calditrichota bacterium]
NILVMSDVGQTKSAEPPGLYRAQTVRIWAKRNGSYHADLLMSGGDQTEDTYDDEYRDFFLEPLSPIIKNTPVYPVVGNNDAQDGRVSVYYRNFTLPQNGESGGYPSGSEGFYSVDYDNVHMVFLATDGVKDIGKKSGSQYKWLLSDMEYYRKNRRLLDWLLVILHHPMHSGGGKGSDASNWQRTIKGLYLPLLEDYGVDLIMAGHNHVYERSYYVYDANRSVKEMAPYILDSGDGREDGNGVYEKQKADNAASEKGEVFITVLSPEPSQELPSTYYSNGYPTLFYHFFDLADSTNSKFDRHAGYMNLKIIGKVLHAEVYGKRWQEEEKEARVLDFFTIDKSKITYLPEAHGFGYSKID